MEIIQCAGVQDQSGNEEKQSKENIQNQIPCVGHGDEQPSGEQAKQQQVGNELNQPELPAPQAAFEGLRGYRKVCHHLTSITAASLVAKTDGWYIG